MKIVNFKKEQLNKLNEDAEIIDINNPTNDNEPDIDDKEESDILKTLDSLVDDVMDAAEAVRDYYRAYEGCFGDSEIYAKDIDDKMNYILSDLF